MSGRFLDKTKFSLTARTLAQLRERRNPKGKYKSKSKFKRLIRLNLRPDLLRTFTGKKSSPMQNLRFNYQKAFNSKNGKPTIKE